MKKKIMIPVLLIVVILAIAVGLKPQGNPGAKALVADAAPSANKLSVKVRKAKEVTLASGMEFKATLEASEEGIVSSKVSGKVIGVLFEKGKYVKKGDPLVKLDDQELRNSIKSAESQMAAVKANLENLNLGVQNAQREYDRTLALYNEGAVSKSEMENAQAALKTSHVNLTTAEANLQTAQVNVSNAYASLANTTITAPISGVISEKNLEIGQFANPGAALGKVINISPIVAAIDVDQNDFALLKVGEKAQIDVGENNNQVYEGIVNRIAPSADTATRSFEVQVQIQNQDQALKPGIFATVKLANGRNRKVIALPTEALTGSEGNYSVYVNDKGIARKRSVAIGEIAQNLVEIKSGVQKGDSVIISNVSTLQDGDAVNAVSE